MSIINEIDLSNTGLTTRSNRFNSSINVNDNACDDFIESEKNLGGAQIVETYENDLYKWKPNHLLMSNFYTYVINNESIYDTTYNNMVNLYNSIIEKQFNTLKLLDSFDETFSDIQLLSIIYNNVTTGSSSYTINLFDNIKNHTFKLDIKISSNKIINNNYYNDFSIYQPYTGHMDYDGTFYLNSMNSTNRIKLTTYNYENPSITRELTINCQTNNSTSYIEFDNFYNRSEPITESYLFCTEVSQNYKIIPYKLMRDDNGTMRSLENIVNIDKKDNEPFFVESININLVKNCEIKKITGSNILNYTKLDGKSSRPIYWFLNEPYFRNKQMIFAVKKHYKSDEPNSVYGEDFYYLEEIDKISASSKYYSGFTINILDNSILDSSNEEYKEEYYMIIIANNKSYLYKLNFIYEDYTEIDSCIDPNITCNCKDNSIDISHLLKENEYYNLKENTKYDICIDNDNDNDDDYEKFNILSISVKHSNDNDFNDHPCIKKNNTNNYYELYTSGKGNYTLMITFSHITGIYNTKTINISVGETETAKYLTSSDVGGNVNIDIQENLINNLESDTNSTSDMMFIDYEHDYTLNEICYIFTGKKQNDISIIPSSLQIEYDSSRYDSLDKSYISKDFVDQLYFERYFATDGDNNVISNKLNLTCNIKKHQYEETNGIAKNAIIPVKLYYYNGKDKNYIEKTTYINIDLSGYFEEPTENPILPSTGDETGDSSLDSSLDTVNI